MFSDSVRIVVVSLPYQKRGKTICEKTGSNVIARNFFRVIVKPRVFPQGTSYICSQKKDSGVYFKKRTHMRIMSNYFGYSVISTTNFFKKLDGNIGYLNDQNKSQKSESLLQN
jgi:hypothetical protein